MRKTALLLALGTALLAAAARTRASRKSIATEDRYSANFTAVWTVLNKLMPIATAENAGFLSGLGQMTVSPDYPLPDDGNGGAYWADGERDYINNCVDTINDLVQKLQRQGYMS